jgi:hypothetical protein
MPLMGPLPGYPMKPYCRGPRDGLQLTTHANSAAPASISLSNTVPGYLTPGGKFRFNVPGSTEADYAIFGYQVPATHRLILDGVAISTAIAVALTTTASLLEWAMSIDGVAASLADAGGCVVPLGVQGFVASAAVGIQAPDIVRRFGAPLIVEPGKYLHVICRHTVGGSTGTMRGHVNFSGWFDPADGIGNGG